MAVPSVTDFGVPETANAGQPIHVWVNLSSPKQIDEVLLTYSNPGTGELNYEFMVLSIGNSTSGTWTYEIPAQPWKGELECHITAKDITGASLLYPASGNAIIEIQGDNPPKQFPWNWVIIIGFLAVVLVLTELVFKPGLYRPTGRERAKVLEEEDRKREQEESEKKV